MFGRSTFASLPKMSQVCSGCGCVCSVCSVNSSLDLQRDVEQVKALLSTERSHVAQLERELAGCRDKAESDISRLKEEQIKLRDRYDRLLDSHRKMQKVNNNLEDKLLKVVEQLNSDKQELLSNMSELTDKLSEASTRLQDLEVECERYQNDCTLAVSLLQCKPSEFVEHRLTALPLDLQRRVREHLTPEQQRDLDFPPLRSSSSHVSMEMDHGDIISGQPQILPRVPMPTFPPIAVFDPVPVPQRPAPMERGAALVPMSAIAQALSVPSGGSMRRSYSATSFVKQRTERVDGSTQTDAEVLIDVGTTGRPAAGLVSARASGRLLAAGGTLSASGTTGGMVMITEGGSTGPTNSKPLPTKSTSLSPTKLRAKDRTAQDRATTKTTQRLSAAAAANDRWMDDDVLDDNDDDKSGLNDSRSSHEVSNKAAAVTVHKPLHSTTASATYIANIGEASKSILPS